MPADHAADSLQEQLNRLAAQGAKRLKLWVLRCACDRYLRLLLPTAVSVSGAILLAELVGAAAGVRLWGFGMVGTVLVALALPVLVVAGCVLVEFARHRVDRRMCLALYDRDLNIKDRLQAADEYLAKAERSDFEAAAVEDARRYASAALQRSLPPLDIRPPGWLPPHRKLGALALALLAAALWIGQQSVSDLSAGEALVAEAASGDVRQLPAPAQVLPDPPQPRSTALEVRRNARVEAPKAEAQSSPGELETRQLSSQRQANNRSAAGSEARRSNQARQAQSGASGQRAEMQEQDENESETREQRPRKPAKPPAEPEQQPKESAGLKGGKGGMSGGRMTASDHAAAQDKTRQPEPEGDADFGDDEEDEEQKAGSASKPLISQRKAPVNRSLTPSADSDEERDDQNGRGGPSGLKKTRGVAAMLLGVPLPDYLQGKVNPGRMKIQSEQGRAEERQADPALAQERPARDAAVGHTLHREIPPLSRDVVRNYFLAQRTNGGQTPEDYE